MAVTHVGAGALAVVTTGTTVTLAQPTCSVGDLLVAYVVTKALNITITAPDATWTQVYQDNGDCTTAADDHRFSIWWKVATATTGNHVFSRPSSTTVVFGGVISAFTGQDADNPIDATAVAASVNVAQTDNLTFSKRSLEHFRDKRTAEGFTELTMESVPMKLEDIYGK